MTRLLRTWRRRLADEAGFTLLEAVVSFAVFAIVITAATWAITNALRTSHTSQQRVQAADIAQAVVNDAIRMAATIEEVPAPGTTLEANLGSDLTKNLYFAEDDEFNVVKTVIYDKGGSCNTGTMFTINVAVYNKRTSQFLARSDARVACPRA
jgi:type II secretory pathway pseudopilin PulG